MFDAVTRPAPSLRSRFGAGAGVSLALHALLFAAAVALSLPREQPAPEKERTWRPVIPMGARPLPSKGSSTGSATAKTPAVKRKSTALRAPTTVQPRPLVPAAPQDLSVSDSEPVAERLGVPDGSDTGSPDGTRDGSPDGLPGGGGGEEIAAFTQGMTRPQLLAGPAIAYPREAIEAHVEGTMLARCVITTAGTLEDCRIIKGLAYMDQPVLAALARYRFSPVTYEGRPVAVQYVIPIRVVAR